MGAHTYPHKNTQDFRSVSIKIISWIFFWGGGGLLIKKSILIIKAITRFFVFVFLFFHHQTQAEPLNKETLELINSIHMISTESESFVV